MFEERDKTTFVSRLLSTQREAFAKAVADFATRLQFCAVTAKPFRDLDLSKKIHTLGDPYAAGFGVGHASDARLIKDGLLLWKPVFSAELLPQTLTRQPNEDVSARLTEDTYFKPPLSNRHSDRALTYLSAVGGYGLALPYEARDDANSIATLKTIFLSNPRLMHPYLFDMLADSSLTAQHFVERHGRPRWPFWVEVEAEFMKMLEALFCNLDRSYNDPKEFWTAAYRRIKDDPKVRGLIDDFLEETTKIAIRNHCALIKIQ
jgi:hypothetical protein